MRSTIPATLATAAVSMVGTWAILGVASDVLNEARGARVAPPAAIAQDEPRPVPLRLPVFDEPSPIRAVRSTGAGIDRTKTVETPPQNESNPPPQPSPPTPACVAPVVGEIPSLPVVGCLLEGVPF